MLKKMWKKSGIPGIVSKIGKRDEVEKKYSQNIQKKFEVLGNMSKIGKKFQDCVRYQIQAGVVIRVRKVRYVRLRRKKSNKKLRS